MKTVILESPYAANKMLSAPPTLQRANNVVFARACMRDCLLHDEAPFASHLLYTQIGVLDDEVPEDRKLGMRAGFAFYPMMGASVVYVNRGVSSGMKFGIAQAVKHKIPIRIRALTTTTMDTVGLGIGLDRSRSAEDMIGAAVDELADILDGAAWAIGF